MISVVIPALNESARVQSVVSFAVRNPLVSEVIVVDDGSVDGTPELARAAGAHVIVSTMRGKGSAMRDGLEAATGQVIVYLDADLDGLRYDLIDKLCRPILSAGADFVKARFSRNAGRVTMLTAKPLLQVFFPEIAQFHQPLGGIIAGRRSVLEALHFETDYGVDLGLLIDAVNQGYKVIEADIGHVNHESQSLEALSEMAKQVVRALLHRANRMGRLSGDQVLEVEEGDRHAKADLSITLESLGQVERMALIDMDGTLLAGRFVLALAKATGREDELHRWLDNRSVSDEERAQQIAAIFQGVPRKLFEQVARSIPLSDGAAELVIRLRKAGYRVGIVTDSYMVAADIVRRRVFADFCVANLMRFHHGDATGELTMSPAWQREDGCEAHKGCKGNAVRHLCERLRMEPSEILAIGDSDNDICMLRLAGTSVAFEPKSRFVREAATHTVRGSLLPVANLPGVLPGMIDGAPMLAAVGED